MGNTSPNGDVLSIQQPDEPEESPSKQIEPIQSTTIVSKSPSFSLQAVRTDNIENTQNITGPPSPITVEQHVSDDVDDDEKKEIEPVQDLIGGKLDATPGAR